MSGFSSVALLLGSVTGGRIQWWRTQITRPDLPGFESQLSNIYQVFNFSILNFPISKMGLVLATCHGCQALRIGLGHVETDSVIAIVY